MFPLVIMGIYKGLTPEDQKYFRESREAALGMTLEKASQRPILMCLIDFALHTQLLNIQTTAAMCVQSSSIVDGEGQHFSCCWS